MTDTRKAQLEIGVNAGPAEEGFKRVERAAKGMSDGVAKAGAEASKGMDGIGKGAEAIAVEWLLGKYIQLPILHGLLLGWLAAA